MYIDTKRLEMLKAQQQIFKKRCFEKYCSCDKACHFQLYRAYPDEVIWKN